VIERQPEHREIRRRQQRPGAGERNRYAEQLQTAVLATERGDRGRQEVAVAPGST